MHRKLYLIAGLVLFSHVFALVESSGAFAADCKALHDKIRKERTLMRKKQMAVDAVKVCPNDAPIVYQYGYSLERLRKYEDALKQYQKAVKLDSTYAKAYFSVGDIQSLLRNYREAVVAYQIGLLHEDDGRAKISLKEARGKYKELTGKDAPAPPPPLEKKKTVVVKKAAVEPVAAAKKNVTAPKPSATVSYAEAPIIRLQVPFFKKSTNLSQDARDVLAVVVGQAMQRPDMKNVRFEIGGHTDNIGDSNKNEEISKKRAETVKAYLVKNFGISADRLSTASHGQKLPKVPNTSPTNQEINRRVEFTKIN